MIALLQLFAQQVEFALSPPLRRLPLTEKKLTKLTDNPSSWQGASLLSVQQITRGGLGLLFEVASQMRDLVEMHGGDDRLKHHLVGTVFFEKSTRTTASFQAAIQRLGGSFVDIHQDVVDNEKESLEDTIRCVESYTDVTVLRHPVSGSLQKALQVATKPIINAGDGEHEHPTQALLDAYTIAHELNLKNFNYHGKSYQELTVVLAGDLKHGRTVHSLAALLAETSLWNKLRLRYCAPPGLELPQALQEYISKQQSVEQESYGCNNLEEACQDANVLYTTQCQHIQVNMELLNGGTTPRDMVVLHPLPRSEEINPSVDADPRAAYFRQVHNGMLVRMALLALICGKV